MTCDCETPTDVATAEEAGDAGLPVEVKLTRKVLMRGNQFRGYSRDFRAMACRGEVDGEGGWQWRSRMAGEMLTRMNVEPTKRRTRMLMDALAYAQFGL